MYTLYISFRNTNGYINYKSPGFTTKGNLLDVNDSMYSKLMSLTSKKKKSFTIDGELEARGSNLILLLNNDYDPKWIKKLEDNWSETLGFSIPNWNTWVQVNDLQEAYK